MGIHIVVRRHLYIETAPRLHIQGLMQERCDSIANANTNVFLALTIESMYLQRFPRITGKGEIHGFVCFVVA